MARLIALLLAILPASAHMPDRPDLDNWFMHLKANDGMACCDISEAEKVADPDWDTKDGHFRVYLEGKWWDVPDGSVVTGANRYGPALAWPVRYNGVIVRIRCFLPGAGT